MGGELERVDIVPLGEAIDFDAFAVENAKCFDSNDKAKLLTAIESAFGAYAPFNTLVRSLLAKSSGAAPGEGPRRRKSSSTTGDRRRQSSSKYTASTSAQVHPEGQGGREGVLEVYSLA